jgi:hypothetical protein
LKDEISAKNREMLQKFQTLSVIPRGSQKNESAARSKNSYYTTLMKREGS